MTIFKSRQANPDPLPYVDAVGVRTNYPHGAEDKRYDPRPEFEPTRDPQPWCVTDEPNETVIRSDRNLDDPREPGIKSEWAPRRERYDTPVNPILVAFRADWSVYVDARTPNYSLGNFARDTLDKYLVNGWPSVFHHEIDHARRVLTRLARLEESQ